MLFFVPFAGLALGAGFGALFGHLGKKGIDEDTAKLQEALTPEPVGASA